jgi:hypothetical protein
MLLEEMDDDDRSPTWAANAAATMGLSEASRSRSNATEYSQAPLLRPDNAMHLRGGQASNFGSSSGRHSPAIPPVPPIPLETILSATSSEERSSIRPRPMSLPSTEDYEMYLALSNAPPAMDMDNSTAVLAAPVGGPSGSSSNLSHSNEDPPSPPASHGHSSQSHSSSRRAESARSKSPPGRSGSTDTGKSRRVAFRLKQPPSSRTEKEKVGRSNSQPTSPVAALAAVAAPPSSSVATAGPSGKLGVPSNSGSRAPSPAQSRYSLLAFSPPPEPPSLPTRANLAPITPLPEELLRLDRRLDPRAMFRAVGSQPSGVSIGPKDDMDYTRRLNISHDVRHLLSQVKRKLT